MPAPKKLAEHSFPTHQHLFSEDDAYSDLVDNHFRVCVCVCVSSVKPLTLFSLTKKDSIINWARSGVELGRQRREMEYYRREIQKLDLQIEGLSTNRDSMETYAREQFHFAKPGDDVYILEK